MGFETVVPAPPTRDEELRMIKATEEQFLQQPRYKLYMNEAHRIAKMNHGDRHNNIRAHFWSNFALGLLITGPIFIIPFGKAFRNLRSGVPYYFRPKYVFTQKNQYNQDRNWGAMKKQIPLWLGLSTAYAYWFTDFSINDDEWLEKGKVIYPHQTIKVL
ncbi:hypothetical protein ABPG74_016654 [Tetrahymena malaccensis]